MNKQQQLQMALGGVAFFNLVGEMLDELKGTNIYQQRNKRLINSLSEAVTLQQTKMINDGFYDNAEIEEQLRTMEMSGQRILDIFRNSSLEKLAAFNVALENFEKDEYILQES